MISRENSLYLIYVLAEPNTIYTYRTEKIELMIGTQSQK